MDRKSDSLSFDGIRISAHLGALSSSCETQLLNLKFLVLLTCLAVLLGSPAKAVAACGTLEVSKGDIKIEAEKSKKTAPAAAGAKICSGDAIISGKDSRAKIKMEDGNELNISPESKIVLEDYQFNAGQNKKKVLLNILQGKVRAATKQENMYSDKASDGSNNSFQVKTRSAVAGVRGTDFMTGFDPRTNKSDVVTFRGKVEFGQPGPGGTILNPVTVGAGQKTEALPGQPPAPPRAVPQKELQQMSNESKADSGGTKDAGSSGSTASSEGENKEKDKGSGDKKDSGDQKSGSADSKDSGDKQAGNDNKDQSGSGDQKSGDKSEPSGDKKSAGGEQKEGGGAKQAAASEGKESGGGKEPAASDSKGSSNQASSEGGNSAPAAKQEGSGSNANASSSSSGNTSSSNASSSSGGGSQSQGQQSSASQPAASSEPTRAPASTAPAPAAPAPAAPAPAAPALAAPPTSMLSGNDLGGGVGFANQTTPPVPTTSVPTVPVVQPVAAPPQVPSQVTAIQQNLPSRVSVTIQLPTAPTPVPTPIPQQ